MGCTEIRRSFVEKNHVKVETVLMQLPGRTNYASDPIGLGCHARLLTHRFLPAGGGGGLELDLNWSIYEMSNRQASRTAIATAYLRAAHQLLDAPPRVLEDPVAVRLLGKDASQNICRSG